MQEDFGHKVAVDLINGVILIDYSEWGIQNGTVEIHSPQAVFYICDETNIIANLFDIETTEPNSEGVIYNAFIPIEWRPIWFTRVSAGIPTKVIGAQTTLPANEGGKNIKKLVSIFQFGALGID